MDANGLEYFRDDCAALTAKEFARQHGDGFLLHHGPLAGLERADRIGQTRVVEPGSGDGMGISSGFIVFSVRTTGRSPFPGFISVGRVDKNDVFLEDPSLSKFHAYIRHEEGGEFLLHDAGSKNGTFVDDEPVLTKETGDPTQLRSGARVRFGQVELTFLAAAEFRSFVETMAV